MALRVARLVPALFALFLAGCLAGCGTTEKALVGTGKMPMSGGELRSVLAVDRPARFFGQRFAGTVRLAPDGGARTDPRAEHQREPASLQPGLIGQAPGITKLQSIHNLATEIHAVATTAAAWKLLVELFCSFPTG